MVASLPAVVLVGASLGLSAKAHSHYPRRHHSGHFVERAPQTGPGYDPKPLDQIVPLPAEFQQDTVPLPTEYPAGSQPPITGAPVIPNFVLGDTPWPTEYWGEAPPVDSPQVKEWLKELEGHEIPDIPLNEFAKNGDGSLSTRPECGNNPEAVKRAKADKHCWWTCGQCLRDTDISACPSKLDWGLTFDDGPVYYTPKLLNYLDSVNTKATFYVLGTQVVSHPASVVYEHMQGHEIAIHGWSHSGLTGLSNEQIVAELGWTRLAVEKVIGVKPKYMRPPYGDIDDRVRAVVHAMGMQPVLWTSLPDTDGDGVTTQWDSEDWRVHDGSAKAVPNQERFEKILDSSVDLPTGFITLQHDSYVEMVDIAIGSTIPFGLNHTPAFNLKPVNICQGRPLADAYTETSSTPVPEFKPSGDYDNSYGGSDDTTTTGSTTGSKTDTSTGPTRTRTSTSSTSSATESSTSAAAGRVSVGFGAVSLAAVFTWLNL